MQGSGAEVKKRRIICAQINRSSRKVEPSCLVCLMCFKCITKLLEVASQQWYDEGNFKILQLE